MAARKKTDRHKTAYRKSNRWYRRKQVKMTLEKVLRNTINDHTSYCFIPDDRKVHTQRICADTIGLIVAIELQELESNPERYVALNVIDAHMIIKFLRKDKELLNHLKHKNLYFHNNPIHPKNRKQADRYYLCLIQNEFGFYLNHVYGAEYIVGSGKFKILCLPR